MPPASTNLSRLLIYPRLSAQIRVKERFQEAIKAAAAP
jgi:hypothetical protein